MTDSLLVNFHKGLGVDHGGRRIGYIHTFDDTQLEYIHDYIQWIFPLPEPSAHFPGAPVMLPSDMFAMKNCATVQSNLCKSFAMMMSFYIRNRGVIQNDNHNLLRLTRIIRCITLLGHGHEADVLMLYLREFPISSTTWEFWWQARAS